MARLLLLCSTPTLSLRLSLFVGKKDGIEFSNYRDLDSALPVEAQKEYDFVVVVSFLKNFDLTARVPIIRSKWPKAKVIVITELESSTQQICRKTVVNEVVYLFWHFESREDIRRLLEESFGPELKIKEEKHRFKNEVTSPIKLSNLERLKQPIVVIASSTGGFAALRKIISCLPSDFRAPIIIAQHMPKGFEDTLIKSLVAVNAHLDIQVAREGTISSRQIQIIPYDYHGVIKESGNNLSLSLNQDPLEHSLRPAADPLFRSASKLKNHRVIAAILTGMGSDGTLGGKEIKKAGGIIICQDKDTSAVWGMPRMAVQEGICDKEVPLSAIGEVLFDLTK